MFSSNESPKIPPSCSLVIFGATGDLTARRLMPALYNLASEALLPSQFCCVGFSRRPKTHEEFRTEVYQSLQKYSRTQPINETVWQSFKEHLFYFSGEFHIEEDFKRLKTTLDELDKKFGTEGNRLFYLSTAASFFSLICSQLHKVDLIAPQKEDSTPFARIIIEKPFGRDLNSAIQLQKELLTCVSEKQIFRIDHYLGKETVQNLLVFRFGNSIFESLWNNRSIDHVQISFAEDLGIGSRGAFWEESGLLRDVVQNHLMQLLCLTAMEPPAHIQADLIQNEKVKVLECIRPIKSTDIIRGQYKAGYINGKPVPGYREEANVKPTSTMESFVALEMYIDNWRWEGVPFYIRAGKRLPKRSAEITIFFKNPPVNLFSSSQRDSSNILVIRIQPDEGIALRINCKLPGHYQQTQPVKMDFLYSSFFGLQPPEAYERLIPDAMLGDTTLFAREDEVLHSWKLFTPILEEWSNNSAIPFYDAGTWGPEESSALIAKEGRAWRLV